MRAQIQLAPGVCHRRYQAAAQSPPVLGVVCFVCTTQFPHMRSQLLIAALGAVLAAQIVAPFFASEPDMPDKVVGQPDGSAEHTLRFAFCEHLRNATETQASADRLAPPPSVQARHEDTGTNSCARKQCWKTRSLTSQVAQTL